jgi:hypothetical protein
VASSLKRARARRGSPARITSPAATGSARRITRSAVERLPWISIRSIMMSGPKAESPMSARSDPVASADDSVAAGGGSIGSGSNGGSAGGASFGGGPAGGSSAAAIRAPPTSASATRRERIHPKLTRPAIRRHARSPIASVRLSLVLNARPAVIRIAPLGLALVALVACNDLRDFRGAWSGARVGDNPALRVGVATEATARLTLDRIDRHGLGGTLDVDGLVAGAALVTVPGAEADALAGLSFDGAPLRVYLGFVATTDGGGDALAMVALYDDDRLEVRVLRGGPRPIYGIFALHR